MTRREAAGYLRELAAGDTSVYGQALAVAVRALEPATAKRKAKTHPGLTAFLRIRFPAPDLRNVCAPGELSRLYALNGGFSPQARAQFTWNGKGRRP